MASQEAWSGYKLNVSQLRVFGCIIYTNILDENRKGIDDKV